MNLIVFMRWVFVILAAFTFLAIHRPLAADECNETIIIDSTVYNLPLRWCGHKLEAADKADMNHLVKLPAEWCYDTSKIYVLPDTREAFIKMAEAARADSVKLTIDSGFRSAAYQRQIIKRRMEEGKSFEQIIEFVAPPGYSEHETGRAIDLVPSDASFAHTKAYKWLKENAHLFGFFETYPKTKDGLMPWESSHWCFKPSK